MKKKSLKFLTALIGITMLSTSVFSGCGSKATSSEYDPNQDPKAIKGTITYWTQDDPGFVKANKKLIEDFEKQYPDIKVTYQCFPYDVLINKLKAAYSAKNESDVQQLFGSWAINYAKHGLLAEVPEGIAKEVRNTYYTASYGGYIYNDKLYGIPKEVNVENGGVLYHPEELKAAGYDHFPATYKELTEAAKKLTQYDEKGNMTHAGFDFASFDNQTYTLLSFILQQGGSYWKNDKIHVDFSTPEAEKAMQAISDLLIKDKVTDLKHTNNMTVDPYTYFFQGKSAMCFRGAWSIASGINEFKLNNFDYGKMPSFTGNSFAFASESGWGEVVSNRCKNKAAAWTFVKFMTSPENAMFWNSTSFTIPAIKANAQSPAFVEKQPMMKPTLSILDNGQAIGPVYDVDQFKTIINTHIQRMVDGKEDIKVALSNIEKEENAMIDSLKDQ